MVIFAPFLRYFGQISELFRHVLPTPPGANLESSPDCRPVLNVHFPAIDECNYFNVETLFVSCCNGSHNHIMRKYLPESLSSSLTTSILSSS